MKAVVRWCSAAAAVAFALVLAPVRASACETVAPAFLLRVPADGATGVPTNARVWIGATDEGGEPVNFAGLLRDDGSEVPSTPASLMSNLRNVLVITPKDPLVPGGHYTVVTESRATGKASTSFTVGTGANTQPPSIPSVLSEKTFVPEDRVFAPKGPGTCNQGDPIDSVQFELQHDGLIAVVDLNNSASLDGASGRVSDLTDGTSLFVSGKNDTTITVRFGAIDLAGNFSGWSETRTEELPDAPWGCSSAGGRASSMGATGVVLLGALALLRTRRRRA